METFTFEIQTTTGDWKPVFCRSLNSTDTETGCSVIACRDAPPYEAHGIAAAHTDLAYFARFAGADRVRIARPKLPQGKINVRFRQLRGVWQVFAGRTYLDGANADTPAEALAELTQQYNVPTGTPAIIHNSQFTKTVTL